MEDLRATTTDSMSDVDVQDAANFWPPQKSLDSNRSRSESHSLMSLNSSQNEFEGGTVHFIESEDLAERLAALGRSELAPVPNGRDDAKRSLLRRSDGEDLSVVGQSGGDAADSLHQSRVEKRPSAEMESPRTSVQTQEVSQVKGGSSEELSEEETRRKTLVDSGLFVPTAKDDVSKDEQDASLKVSSRLRYSE